jgi:hypothetical protein
MRSFRALPVRDEVPHCHHWCIEWIWYLDRGRWPRPGSVYASTRDISCVIETVTTHNPRHSPAQVLLMFLGECAQTS